MLRVRFLFVLLTGTMLCFLSRLRTPPPPTASTLKADGGSSHLLSMFSITVSEAKVEYCQSYLVLLSNHTQFYLNERSINGPGRLPLLC